MLVGEGEGSHGSGVTEDSTQFRGNLHEWTNFKAHCLVHPAEGKPCPPKNTLERHFIPAVWSSMNTDGTIL